MLVLLNMLVQWLLIDPLKMLLINQTREPWQKKGGPLRQFVQDTFGGSSISIARQLIQIVSSSSRRFDTTMVVIVSSHTIRIGK